jgi:hypothetical protein
LLLDLILNPCGRGRPDTWQQLQHPKPRNSVGWIFAPPKDTDNVFHMRRFEKFQTAVLRSS